MFLINLLEWRAARLVEEHARTLATVDATVNQRISKAVTEAFIAVQVGEITGNLTLPEPTCQVVRSLYTLVHHASLISHHF